MSESHRENGCRLRTVQEPEAAELPSTPTLVPLLELLRADYEATQAIDPLRPRGLARTLDVLTQPGFLCIVLYRFASAAKRRNRRILARLLLLAQTMLFGAEIYPGAVIGPGLTLVHPVGVGIGAGVVMGRDMRLHGQIRIGSAGFKDPEKDGFPVFGDGCTIYDCAMVFGPIEVGAGSRIGANALLMESVPPGSLVTAPRAEVKVKDRPMD